MARKRKVRSQLEVKRFRHDEKKRKEKEAAASNAVDAARAVGRCCLGNLCQHPTLQLTSEFTCLKCKGLVHVPCAIWDNNVEKYICQQCATPSIIVDVNVVTDLSQPSDEDEYNIVPAIVTQQTQQTTTSKQTPPTLSIQPTAQINPSAETIPIDPIAVNLPTVPDLCSTINRDDRLDECLSALTRTQTTGSNHKACVCVICDCFIIGIEKICWLSEAKLQAKQSVLSVHFVEERNQKPIPIGLRNQYKIHNNEPLSNLLLSPRAHFKDGLYMSCKPCHKHIAYYKSDKPPKFAISNGWMIGQIPRLLINKDIPDILASSLARVRVFGNVYSYSAGAHKSIKGHHVFLFMTQNMLGHHLNI